MLTDREIGTGAMLVEWAWQSRKRSVRGCKKERSESEDLLLAGVCCCKAACIGYYACLWPGTIHIASGNHKPDALSINFRVACLDFSRCLPSNASAMRGNSERGVGREEGGAYFLVMGGWENIEHIHRILVSKILSLSSHRVYHSPFFSKIHLFLLPLICCSMDLDINHCHGK